MRALFLMLSFVAAASTQAPLAADAAPADAAVPELVAEPVCDGGLVFGAVEAPYPSTYNSSCFCLACSRYCDVDGHVVKAGTCC